ncbi:MAG: baseplate J/gp47 family protein [Chloroflexota bacterium]
MADEPQVIYLEPDDEITSLVRRVRAAESRSVVIVAPGRSRATSSAVALRLLAQVAAEEKRTLSLVADPATRAVAGEAGIPAFASVAEATSGGAAPDPGAAAPRAPIHVVRGLPQSAPIAAAAVPLAAAAARSGPGDETVAVRLPSPPSGRRRLPRLGGSRRNLPGWRWLAALLVMLLVVAAALVPAATVHIAAASEPVGPKTYSVHLSLAGRLSDNLSVTRPGTATGARVEQIAATGNVTFSNWTPYFAVAIPKETSVSASGSIAFATNERIVVQVANFNGKTIVPSQASVAVTAKEPGVTGNLASSAIDTVDDRATRNLLRGNASNKNRLVANADPTTGGSELPHTVILQSDVDAVVAATKADLATQLSSALGADANRLYAGAPMNEVPAVDVPTDLVGKEDTPTFELTGKLAFDRPYVARSDVEKAARETLLRDATAPRPGTSIIDSSIEVQIVAAIATGDQMTIQASVTAASSAPIDEAAVRDLVAGMTVAGARDALRDRGTVTVDLWPPWLDRLPRLAFRISVDQVAPSPGASASP